jgi:hypothetical protein
MIVAQDLVIDGIAYAQEMPREMKKIEGKRLFAPTRGLPLMTWLVLTFKSNNPLPKKTDADFNGVIRKLSEYLRRYEAYDVVITQEAVQRAAALTFIPSPEEFRAQMNLNILRTTMSGPGGDWLPTKTPHH